MLMVGQAAPTSSARFAAAPQLCCVIGCREIMIKHPRRVARALPLPTPFRTTLRRYTAFSIRATSLSRLSTACYYPRATTSLHATTTPTPPLRLTTYIPTYKRTMSSDADYAAFLDKANQDTAPAEQQSSSKEGYGTKSVNTSVPKALESVEEYYVSDADEPFEPVALEFEGESVSAGEWEVCAMSSGHCAH